MSTTTTTTTTTRDRGDRYGPMEWAQLEHEDEVEDIHRAATRRGKKIGYASELNGYMVIVDNLGLRELAQLTTVRVDVD